MPGEIELKEHLDAIDSRGGCTDLAQGEEFRGSVDQGIGGDLEDGGAFVDGLDERRRLGRLCRVQRLQLCEGPL